jgi:hypothetical protein
LSALRFTIGSRHPLADGPDSLALALRARRNCRAGLVGLRVRTTEGQTLRIASTVWGQGSQLVISLDDGSPSGLYCYAATLTLVDRWPVRCCRPSPTRLAAPRVKEDTR